MEHAWWKALQRILDATAFENVGHMRDFETLLDRTAAPAADAKEAPPAPPSRTKAAATMPS